MEDQIEYLAKHQYGGTIRLGAYPCVVKKGTKLEMAYLKYGKGINAPWYIPRDSLLILQYLVSNLLLSTKDIDTGMNLIINI